MRNSRIGIIIPAYNEAEVIQKVLLSIPRNTLHRGKVYTITPIVVDDGSQDTTAEIAEKAEKVVVIRHLLNSGAGAATRTGMRYLREDGYTFGATMDADGQHAAEDLIRVLAAAIDGQSDLIIGSRLVNTAGMPWYKVIGNKGLNLLTRILLGVGSTDSQSGLKAFNRKTIEALNYRESGYAFCSEMLWRAQKANLTISEIPIRAIYTDYSIAKGQSNWNAFQIIKQLLKHRISDLLHE
jgi:glycosyltransferase involved in cell wall biosynthesis